MLWLSKKIAGFYTIQALIYIIISSLMAFLFVNFLTNCYKNRIASNSSLQENLNISIAFDNFLKDYYLANGILILNSENILFNLQDCDICWSFNNNRLMRISGKYIGNGLWSEKFSNLILKDVLSFNIKRSGEYINFYLKLKSNVEFVCPINIKFTL